MRKTFFKLSIFGVVAILIIGCGNYNKLLKSKDHDLLYTEALKYYEAKKYQKTIQLLEIASPFLTGTSKGDSAAYYLAISHYRMGDFQSSSMLFDNFRQSYTTSPFLEDVEYMYAKSFYYMSGPPNRDQISTRRALMAIDEYMERYPNSPKYDVMEEHVDELTQKLHDKAYINAKLYYDIGRYKAAGIAIKNALNQYPESTHREELMSLVAKANYKLAENSYTELQRDRYMDMVDSYYSFISEYPESKYRKDLEKLYLQAQKFLEKFKQTGNQDDEIKDINEII